MKMQEKALVIFEGGGAKGFAHIGALKSARDKFEFIGVAGTSAGAIVAALVAAGYEADDLYNPDSPSQVKGVFDVNFLEFFDRQSWNNLQMLRSKVESLIDCGLIRGWTMTHFNALRHRKVIRNFLKEYGFLRTSNFTTWLEQALIEGRKVSLNPEAKKVLFRHVETPLAIIATDLTNNEIKVFSQERTPDESVSGAVAASISIPLAFHPCELNGLRLVDGGLLSNFPAWVFDEERGRILDDLPPTLGFRLVQLPNQGETKKETFFTYLGDLFSTALSGGANLQYRRVENLHLIPLKVRAKTLDFDLSAVEKEELYIRGRDSASEYLKNYFGPADSEEINNVLAMLHDLMRDALGKNKHLRLNIIMPFGQKKDKLKVLYTYNMDDDADDRLEFSLDAGACGKCWQSHDITVVDLAQAKEVLETEYKMNKYMRALVRPTIKAILCAPIFDMEKFDNNRPKVENPLLGVLAFDSDDELFESFNSKLDIQQIAVDGAKIIAPRLRS